MLHETSSTVVVRLAWKVRRFLLRLSCASASSPGRGTAVPAYAAVAGAGDSGRSAGQPVESGVQGVLACPSLGAEVSCVPSRQTTRECGRQEQRTVAVIDLSAQRTPNKPSLLIQDPSIPTPRTPDTSARHTRRLTLPSFVLGPVSCVDSRVSSLYYLEKVTDSLLQSTVWLCVLFAS